MFPVGFPDSGSTGSTKAWNLAVWPNTEGLTSDVREVIVAGFILSVVAVAVFDGGDVAPLIADTL